MSEEMVVLPSISDGWRAGMSTYLSAAAGAPADFSNGTLGVWGIERHASQGEGSLPRTGASVTVPDTPHHSIPTGAPAEARFGSPHKSHVATGTTVHSST